VWLVHSSIASMNGRSNWLDPAGAAAGMDRMRVDNVYVQPYIGVLAT
jgi:hypothetical protein